MSDSSQKAMPMALGFLDPGRTDREILFHQADKLTNHIFLRKVIESSNEIVYVTNDQRQIVVSNNKALEYFKVAEGNDIIGLRVGEVLNCVESEDGFDGCTTGPSCLLCGIAHAMVEAQQTHQVVSKASHIVIDEKESADLLIKVTPFEDSGEWFYITSLIDLQKEKRLRALEKTFFHDVNNLTFCLTGYAELLQKNTSEHLRKRILKVTHQLCDELKNHRHLLAAESDDIKPRPETVTVQQILADIKMQYSRLLLASDRQLCVLPSADSRLITDRVLLHQVLGNLIKISIKASPMNGVVSIAAHVELDRLIVTVETPGFLRNVEHINRLSKNSSPELVSECGLDSYGVVLLCEKYLGGKVAVRSCQENGTTFTLAIPMHWDHAFKETNIPIQ